MTATMPASDPTSRLVVTGALENDRTTLNVWTTADSPWVFIESKHTPPGETNPDDHVFVRVTPASAEVLGAILLEYARQIRQGGAR